MRRIFQVKGFLSPVRRMAAKMSNEVLNILSLGAGVQSTTVALLTLHQKLPPLDHIIFADPGWESPTTYRHLEWLTDIFRQHDIPIHTVSNGNIRNDLVCSDPKRRWPAPPVFSKYNGKTGQLLRQCTQHYKIQPIEQKVRQILNLRKRARWPKEHIVDQWIGFSRDEMVRMKASMRPAIRNVFPLVELGMTKGDCIEWLKRHDYRVPPKSSCIGCPYHSDAYWREMKTYQPNDWEDACTADACLRTIKKRGIKGELFLHRSAQPLADVDLRNAEDEGQLSMFADECFGLCGT